MVKFSVGNLVKEELEYELNIRGMLVEGETVDKMRTKLRAALKAELGSDTSFVCPNYPYTYEQDIEALNRKLEEVQKAVDDYKKHGREADFRKGQTKAEFALRRAGHTQAIKPEECKELMALRSQFIILLGSLFSDDVNSEEDEVGGQSPFASSTPRHGMVVASREATQLDITKWGVKFSGEHTGSVNSFLERIEEMRIARGVSKDQLFKSAVELFESRALIWFRANRNRVGNWDSLVTELREEFMPPDYDDRLWEEIRRRTQGGDESMGMYVAVMERMFSRLRVPCEEAAKMRVLRRNIAPFYQTQLGLKEVGSIQELIRLGRVLEATRASVEAYVPPARRSRQSLEPDLAYVGECVMAESEENTMIPVAALNCWTCGERGHCARDCRRPIRCFGCGKEGVRIAQCATCGKRRVSRGESWRNEPRGTARGNTGNGMSEEGRNNGRERPTMDGREPRRSSERVVEQQQERRSDLSGNENGAR